MPLFFVGGWSAMITLVSKFVWDRMLTHSLTEFPLLAAH